jgi:peptidoglycan/LPS O-acetylase OafA/YrhL
MSSEADLAASRQSRRLVFVDLLRGIACLWVIYCHFHGVWLNDVRPHGWNFDTLLVRIAGFGGKGVDLFVVISGFCLFYPILQRWQAGKELRILSFYQRRAVRIFPVYFAVLAVSIVMVSVPFLRHHIAQYRGLRDAIPYVLLVQNYMPDYTGRINGPLWSVALECQLYLMMPVWVWMFRRHGPILALATAATISVGAGLLGALGLRWGGFAPFANSGLPVRLIEFVAGMGAAWFVLHPRVWHAQAAAALIICTVPGAVLSQTHAGQRILGPVGTLLWGTCFASLVVMACRMEDRQVFHKAWLAPLAWVGLISYSVYAIHFPIMLLLKPVVAPLLITGVAASFAWATVIGVPALILAGAVLYLLIERYSVPAVRRQRVITPSTLPAANDSPEMDHPTVVASLESILITGVSSPADDLRRS